MLDFSADADVIAPQLLGRVVVHGGVAMRITEVEAYLHATDEAAHSFNGKTPRNEALWGPGGHMYIYISYGLHRCCNMVCGPDDTGQGCLIRAGEILAGDEIAWQRRGNVPEQRLASGPGNVGQALGFDISDNHCVITQVDRPWTLDDELSSSPVLYDRAQTPEWVAGPRVGISKNVGAPLRFWIPGHRTVTSPRRAPR